MKTGIECEGRFKGLKTLFISAQEFVDQLGLKIQLVEDIWMQQVYISDLENVLDLQDPNLQALAVQVLVTVERTKLKEVSPEYIHIILRVPVDLTLALLRDGDQIKFEPCEKFVLMIPKGQMIRTRPEDYRGDKQI